MGKYAKGVDDPMRKPDPGDSPFFDEPLPRRRRLLIAVGDWVVFQLMLFLFIDAIAGTGPLRRVHTGLPELLFSFQSIRLWPVSAWWCATFANAGLLIAEFFRKGSQVPLVGELRTIDRWGRISIKCLIFLFTLATGTTVAIWLSNRSPYQRGQTDVGLDSAWAIIAGYPLIISAIIITHRWLSHRRRSDARRKLASPGPGSGREKTRD